MQSKRGAFVFAAFVLSLAAGGVARAELAASPMEEFLGASCPDDALDAAILQSLKARAAEAETWFMSLARNGPTDDMLAAERDAATALYQRRAAFDPRHKVTRSGQGTVGTLADFVMRRLAAYRQRITYRALQGLWAIETPNAIAYLTSLAQDQASPWQAVAQELLATPR